MYACRSFFSKLLILVKKDVNCQGKVLTNPHKTAKPIKKCKKSYRILHGWGDMGVAGWERVFNALYIKKAQIEIRAVAKIQYPIKSL